MPVILQGSEAISAATRADSWLPLRNVYGRPEERYSCADQGIDEGKGCYQQAPCILWAIDTAYLP